MSRMSQAQSRIAELQADVNSVGEAVLAQGKAALAGAPRPVLAWVGASDAVARRARELREEALRDRPNRDTLRPDAALRGAQQVAQRLEASVRELPNRAAKVARGGVLETLESYGEQALSTYADLAHRGERLIGTAQPPAREAGPKSARHDGTADPAPKPATRPAPARRRTTSTASRAATTSTAARAATTSTASRAATTSTARRAATTSTAARTSTAGGGARSAATKRTSGTKVGSTAAPKATRSLAAKSTPAKRTTSRKTTGG
ncbi:MAG: hypothetical protein ACR2JQ_10100 [Mycobacteriales bacterium]